QQRTDDDFDEPQENVADGFQVNGESWKERSNENSDYEGNKNPRRQRESSQLWHLSLSPFQFLAQNIEEQHFRRADQIDGLRRGSADDAVSFRDRFADLAVDRQERTIFAPRVDINDAGIRDDDRPVRQ